MIEPILTIALVAFLAYVIVFLILFAINFLWRTPQKVYQELADAAKDVANRFEQAIEGGRRESGGDREAIAKLRATIITE